MTGKISPRAIGRRSDANDAPKAACLRGIPDKTIYTASPEQGTRRKRFRDNQFGRCGLNKLIIRRMSVKIGAKVVSHGRYAAFQMAEVAIPRNLFADILRLISELRPPPVTSTA